MTQEQITKLLTKTFGFSLPKPGTKSYGLPWFEFENGLIFASIDKGITHFKEIGNNEYEGITRKANEKYLEILYGETNIGEGGSRYIRKNLKALTKDLVITLIKRALINYDRIHFAENRTLNRKSTIKDFKAFVETH